MSQRTQNSMLVSRKDEKWSQLVKKKKTSERIEGWAQQRNLGQRPLLCLSEGNLKPNSPTLPSFETLISTFYNFLTQTRMLL